MMSVQGVQIEGGWQVLRSGETLGMCQPCVCLC